MTTCIYYLSNAMYKDIVSPADHLNSIFVVMDSKEPSNRPRYVRHTRKKKEMSSSSGSNSSDTSSRDASSDENEINCSVRTNETFLNMPINIITQKFENNLNKSFISSYSNSLYPLNKNLNSEELSSELENNLNRSFISNYSDSLYQLNTDLNNEELSSEFENNLNKSFISNYSDSLYQLNTDLNNEELSSEFENNLNKSFISNYSDSLYQLNSVLNLDESMSEDLNTLHIDLTLRNETNLSIVEFKDHVPKPKWGAIIEYNTNRVSVSNTCPIDYYLFAIWVLSKININLLDDLTNFPNTELLIDIIYNIENFNWDLARKIWIVNIMNLHQRTSRRTISLFGSEYGRFFQFIGYFQKYDLY